MLGVTALLTPQIMDGGYGWIQAAMEGKIFWGTMLVLVFMKIVATSCTISSGGSGGVFGPSVFIGAMLGGAFGFLGAFTGTWLGFKSCLFRSGGNRRIFCRCCQSPHFLHYHGM